MPRGLCSAHRVMHELSASGRARSRRASAALRRGHTGSRLARAADLLKMRQPRNRYGDDWDRSTRAGGKAGKPHKRRYGKFAGQGVMEETGPARATR